MIEGGGARKWEGNLEGDFTETKKKAILWREWSVALMLLGVKKGAVKEGGGTRSECSSWEVGPRVISPVPQELMIKLERQDGRSSVEGPCEA